MTAEMNMPIRIEQATATTCFQAGISSRTSRIMRPNGRRPLAGTAIGGAPSGDKATSWSDMIHHGASNSVAISRSVEFGHDTAARHHADAIGDAEHLVEILANQHHRRASVAGRDKPGVHGGAGPNVEPAGRAVGDNDRRREAEFARQNKLLGVAAGQCSGALPQAAHPLHLEFTDCGLGRPPHAGAVDEGDRSEPSFVNEADREIIDN